MGSQPAGVDFALLGHQESWAKISSIVHALRDARRAPLSLSTLRETVPWIPPRTLARLTVSSFPQRRVARGVYIDTFITPDELDARALKRSAAKVRTALECAVREGARLAALGGFTSIVLEGAWPEVARFEAEGLVLTTGNTLTAALIVKGIEQAAQLRGIELERATVLIVGSTGDIGSACAAYFGARVKRLLLVARNAERLERQADRLRASAVDAHTALDIRPLLPAADIILCVASLASPTLDLSSCRPEAVVCDAGYPKNVRLVPSEAGSERVFWGGMGRVLGGWYSASSLLDAFYRFPLPHIAHGCMLEGMLLALEGRYEPFSQGRGRITPERIEEMWGIAQRHGFVVAPLFDQAGLWREQPSPGATAGEAGAPLLATTTSEGRR